MKNLYKTVAVESMDKNIEENHSFITKSYSFPVGIQHAAVSFLLQDNVADVTVAIGNTEEEAVGRVLNLYLGQGGGSVSTGSQGIKPMYTILKFMLGMEDYLRELGVVEISVSGSDDRRDRAYKRLLRYGYEQRGVSLVKELV